MSEQRQGSFFKMNENTLPGSGEYDGLRRLATGDTPPDEVLEGFRQTMSLERVYREHPGLRYRQVMA